MLYSGSYLPPQPLVLRQSLICSPSQLDVSGGAPHISRLALMPGLGLGGGLSGFQPHQQQRPTLYRTFSQVDFTGAEDEDYPSASGAPDPADSRPTTPHEPLSLDFEGPLEVRPAASSTSPPHSPGPLEAPLESEFLPPLPPLSSSTYPGQLLTPALSTGPFTPTLQLLSDDNIFHRQVPQRTSTQTQVRRITPTPLPAPTAATSSSATGRKRYAPSSSSSTSTASGAVTTSVSRENVATAPTPTAPARKKRRGQRAGTYQCLYKGELYECPHGCDIVPKDWLYSVMSR